jgi:hypothetical protein
MHTYVARGVAHLVLPPAVIAHFATGFQPNFLAIQTACVEPLFASSHVVLSEQSLAEQTSCATAARAVNGQADI